MGLKKRSKVSAEFSMSSLTDIIFLLLIFFMLTSNLVAPNAINLKMPGRKSNNPPPKTNDKLTDVKISAKGTFYFNGNKVSTKELTSKMRSTRGKTITISPSSDSPIERVATVMDLAMINNINAILAAEE